MLEFFLNQGSLIKLKKGCCYFVGRVYLNNCVPGWPDSTVILIVEGLLYMHILIVLITFVQKILSYSLHITLLCIGYLLHCVPR